MENHCRSQLLHNNIVKLPVEIWVVFFQKEFYINESFKTCKIRTVYVVI